MHITLDWMMWQFGRPHSRRRRKYRYRDHELIHLPEVVLHEIAKEVATEEVKPFTPTIQVSDIELKKKLLEVEFETSKLREEIYQDLKDRIKAYLAEEDDITALMLLV